MRRTGIIIAIYSILAFAVCFLISNLMKNVPVLLDSEQNSYILVRGFLFFCRFLPSLIFSAFLIGCAIAYGKDSESARVKYSPTIMTHFRKTMIASILIVLVVTMITEVFVPIFENRQQRSKMKPVLFSEFMNLSRENFDKGNMNLAYEYSYNALLLKPKDTDALFINEQAGTKINSLKFINDNKTDSAKKTEKISFVPKKEFEGETVASLLKKAREAMAAENWFDAHYYSYLALEVGNEQDINYNEANRMASESWNHLFDPTAIRETDEQILFRKKRDAFRAFIRGDNIEAYYQFLEISKLSDVAARDPDVKKFLVLARERVGEHPLSKNLKIFADLSRITTFILRFRTMTARTMSFIFAE